MSKKAKLKGPTPGPTSAQKAVVTKTVEGALRKTLESLAKVRATVPSVNNQPHRSLQGTALCLLLSDLHIGKIVEDLRGRIIFDSGIARSRLLEIPGILQSSVSQDIDTVLVLLAGDMVDNETIFHNQPFQIEDTVLQQVSTAVRTIWEILGRLEGIYPGVPIEVVSVPGNHGRTAGATKSNWDNVVYQQLELLSDLKVQASKDSRISVVNQYEEVTTFSIKGWRGLLRHEAPAQVDTSAARALLGGWNTIHNFDMLIYGHFHHWGAATWNDKLVIRNGCLCGGDDYSERFGRSDSPAQIAFTVTRQKLPVSVIPLRFRR